MNERRSEIRSLTGLRGLAACWVMVYHAIEQPARRLIGHLRVRRALRASG
ncbi:MAG: hypothetical protein HIU82_17135 [Proteobacteria bacterium]|nr:hypothetical protein [Pseudomonadota bacterium]